MINQATWIRSGIPMSDHDSQVHAPRVRVLLNVYLGLLASSVLALMYAPIPEAKPYGWPLALSVASLVLGFGFCAFTIWMAFGRCPDVRSGTRVYLARSRPGKKIYALLPLIPAVLMILKSIVLSDAVTGQKVSFFQGQAWYLPAGFVVFIFPLLLFCLSQYRKIRVIEKSVSSMCIGCGQDLSGIKTSICPECSRVYDDNEFSGAVR
jgi:hypothetical protein